MVCVWMVEGSELVYPTLSSVHNVTARAPMICISNRVAIYTLYEPALFVHNGQAIYCIVSYQARSLTDINLLFQSSLIQ